MNFYLRQIFDWSEVWALLIPLAFMIKRKDDRKYLKPVRIYIICAFVINLLATIIWKRYKLGLPEFPDWLLSNNFLYNFHSVIRLILFSWFFILLNQHFMPRLKKWLPFLFMVFVLVNFAFFQDFFNYYIFSSRLLTVEAALLLFYCLQYFIFLTIEDKTTSVRKQPGFWIATGLSIYVGASFIIFLFYTYILEQKWDDYAAAIWDIHNIAYIVLCIFIARGFYERTD